MKKIRIDLLILNLFSVSILIVSLLFGPIETIPLDASDPTKKGKIPTIIFFYLTLITAIISLFILISDYSKTRIKFEILNIPELEMDLINLKRRKYSSY